MMPSLEQPVAAMETPAVEISHPDGHDHGSHETLDRVDPRSRILAAVAFSILVAMLNRLPVLAAACILMFAAAAWSRIPFARLLRQLAPVNTCMLALWICLPFTAGGPAAGYLGPLAVSSRGLWLAATVAVKGNALMLGLIVLLGSLDMITLGHALAHLHVPQKLAHLLLFTVRYLDVLQREYDRLSAAMAVRGFRPRWNGHTYRSYGFLVGMLLVRSMKRAERIVAAMKCRGFRGQFYLLDHFAYSRRDARFAAAWFMTLSVLALLEWYPR